MTDLHIFTREEEKGFNFWDFAAFNLGGTAYYDREKDAVYLIKMSIKWSVEALINHELLHSILLKHVSDKACRKLDNIDQSSATSRISD